MILRAITMSLLAFCVPLTSFGKDDRSIHECSITIDQSWEVLKRSDESAGSEISVLQPTAKGDWIFSLQSWTKVGNGIEYQYDFAAIENCKSGEFIHVNSHVAIAGRVFNEYFEHSFSADETDFQNFLNAAFFQNYRDPKLVSNLLKDAKINNLRVNHGRRTYETCLCYKYRPENIGDKAPFRSVGTQTGSLRLPPPFQEPPILPPAE